MTFLLVQDIYAVKELASLYYETVVYMEYTSAFCSLIVWNSLELAPEPNIVFSIVRAILYSSGKSQTGNPIAI